MSPTNIVDSSSDGDLRGYMKAVKLEPDFVGGSMSQKEFYKNDVMLSKVNSGENQNSTASYTIQGDRSILGQEQSSVDDSGLCSISPICPAPLCRQFWKAGNYDDGLSSKPTHKNFTNYLHIHPKFLHSNATSHKWAFGAIAELLDNAIDEIQNGATFVVVDKIINPRDGSSALLIQDDGGGMDAEAMRRCMSFGFSDKKSKSAIGQYGNGFKTSSMRLGADVIVFSRSMKRKKTRSIGLLSYTFLAQTGLDRIVVPMIDYEYNSSSGTWNSLYSEQNFTSNLSLLLRWSPFSTEEDLLREFVDIGDHGTKIIIYNLWLSDEGKTELDFNSDPEDIRICIDPNKMEKGARSSVSDDHLANRLRFSLRAYLSILYLRVPENFCMVLRGSLVEYHNIANELKYRQCIMYRPQSAGVSEGEVITTIGFLKEAPLVNHHGFNVYHKNRLILPFWHVVSYSDSRGRGVVGVLEADFIQPTHNKQDFEKTPLFQKLEARLKEMTWEYWDYHCGLIGYIPKKKAQPSTTPQVLPESHQKHGAYQSVLMTKNPPSATSKEASRPDNLPRTFHHSYKQVPVFPHKRKERDHPTEPENVKQKDRGKANITNAWSSETAMPVGAAASYLGGEEAANLIQENQKLRAQCLEHEKWVEELNAKVLLVRKQLKETQKEYGRLLLDLKLLEKEKIKPES
nr:protein MICRORCHIDIA 6-like [Ipomoea batatas]